ncbi:MAG TPA: HD domain-containing protein [Candidatus Limnocylindrales bacterium]|nr:HD domain-containing protein [Candidatus Limnocylindrales bacterium]
MIGGARHRVGQFWRHSAGRVHPDESARAAAVLGPDLYALFAALPRNERRHGLDVLATVDRQDPNAERLLRQAALLHDMGKARAGLSIADRSAAVFLQALAPVLLRVYLGLRPGLRHRYGLYREHAMIGAERLREAGAVELAAIVAEHHRAVPSHPLTARLKQADERN